VIAGQIKYIKMLLHSAYLFKIAYLLSVWRIKKSKYLVIITQNVIIEVKLNKLISNFADRKLVILNLFSFTYSQYTTKLDILTKKQI